MSVVAALLARNVVFLHDVAGALALLLHEGGEGFGRAADAFQKTGVTRASSLLKMKAFEGRSLLDLVAAGQLLPEHTQTLIAEAQAMDTAYSRSGLAKSKAAPSDDWRAALSIPGSSE